jgi:hypothetical protein
MHLIHNSIDPLATSAVFKRKLDEANAGSPTKKAAMAKATLTFAHINARTSNFTPSQQLDETPVSFDNKKHQITAGDITAILTIKKKPHHIKPFGAPESANTNTYFVPRLRHCQL